MNKRGEVKGINTGLPNTYHITKLRKLSYHPIGHNSLLIYPCFGIEFFHIRLGINWYDCQSSLLWSAEQGKRFFSVPRPRIWSRETNSVVLSCVSPLIPHIYLHVIQAVYYLRPMNLSVLGYQSHLLQRCHPTCGHEGSFHLSQVLALRTFFVMQVQHSYNSSTNRNGSILFTPVLTLSVTEARNSDFHKYQTHDFRSKSIRCTWLPTRTPLGRRCIEGLF